VAAADYDDIVPCVLHGLSMNSRKMMDGKMMDNPGQQNGGMDWGRATSVVPKFNFRWCRFSLQSFLLVVVIVSIALAWWRDHRRLVAEIEAIRNPKRSWDTSQVLGPPDTPGAGDISTAWASTTPDGQQEWLLLEYESSVRPTAVVIHETYNPGAVTKVSAFTSFGNEVVLWSGTDPTPPTSPRGVSLIPVPGDFRTWRIKVYIDSPTFPGWNEIDAVGLQDKSGETQWASRAYASTSYGGNNEPPPAGILSLLR
jgi:hypothetical protein